MGTLSCFLGTILLIINYVTNPITTLLQTLILQEKKVQQIYLLVTVANLDIKESLSDKQKEVLAFCVLYQEIAVKSLYILARQSILKTEIDL